MNRWFQFRLGTLFAGIAGIALGLKVGQLSHYWLLGTLAGASFWVAFGLLQQARDLWGARGQLTTCARLVVHGWRYAILWRLVIASTISAYWLIQSLEAAQLISFRIVDEVTGSLEIRFLWNWFQLALIISLSSAPWVSWRRPQTVVASIVNVLGWIAGICLALFVLSQVMALERLVHIAICGVEFEQPYAFEGTVIYDMDPLGIRDRTRFLAFLSFAGIGLSLVNVWLAWRRVQGTSHRWLVSLTLLVGLIGCSAFALWVHAAGLQGVSPFLGDTQVWSSWSVWLAASLLLSLFAFSGAYRFHYRAPEESRQRVIAWHRGPGAYLNESRIVMIVLSIVLICAAGDIGSLACDQLTLAALWLSLCGVFARCRIVDRDQRMTPIALSPCDFVVTSIIVATITVGLVEAVAWSSFAGWLL